MLMMNGGQDASGPVRVIAGTPSSLEDSWTVPDGERVLVCVGAGPGSERALRVAHRLAKAVRADLIALHVQPRGAFSLGVEDLARLEQHLQRADELGAEVHTIGAEDRVAAIREFAHRRGIRRIVVGRTPKRWQRFLPMFSADLGSALMRGPGRNEVTVAASVVGDTGHSEDAPRTIRGRDGLGYLLAVIAVGLTTLLGYALYQVPLSRPNIVLVYLLPVVLIAVRGRHGPVVLASLLGVAAFENAFPPPKYAFAGTEMQYLTTASILLLVGLIISTLSSRLRAQADLALGQATVARALHRVSHDLATARGSADLIASATRRCHEILGCSTTISLEASGITAQTGDVISLPLGGVHGPIGALRLTAPGGLDPARRRLAESLARIIGLALECDRLAEHAREARLAAASEQLRNALLSSVSHDLRTPLAAITGSATTLVEDGAGLDPAIRDELARTIADEAERIHAQVSNLLDLTRLEGGAVRVVASPCMVEEVIGSALQARSRRLVGRECKVVIPDDCPLVLVDQVLIHTVLTNLLDNAIDYGGDGPLLITAQPGFDAVVVSVADRGPGLAPDELERVFEKFHRGSASRGRRGIGLGLAICRTIVEAHGGSITAANRQGGGAMLVMNLPMAGPAPLSMDSGLPGYSTPVTSDADHGAGPGAPAGTRRVPAVANIPDNTGANAASAGVAAGRI
jgi:two-component system sensor histidine kinase KdpD